MRGKFLRFVYAVTGLSFASLTLAQSSVTTGQIQNTVKDSISSTSEFNAPIDAIRTETKNDSLPAPISSQTPSRIVSDSTKQSSIAYYFPKYTTDWRCYLDVYGTTAALPSQFDMHLLKFILAYKFIGIGTTAFRIYVKDLKSDSNYTLEDSIKFTAFYAPIYLYYIPFASNRPTGDVTPFATYFYIGGNSWAVKGGKIFDIGIGASMYVWDFNVGFNSISADSRDPLNFFKDSKTFHDYPISWSKFYFSITLSTGAWLSAGSKISKKSPSSAKEPVKVVIPDTLSNK